MPKQIKDIAELKALATKQPLNCFIALRYGLISRKTLKYLPKSDKWSIINHIDDSQEKLTTKQLLDERITNIGKALEVKALYRLT